MVKGEGGGGGGEFPGVKPLIPREGNSLKHKNFDLNTFMQGIDKESLENIAMTST
jgi:hypothetical protein